MKLTDVSQMLLSVFQQNKPNIKLKRTTENILLNFHQEMQEAYKYIIKIQPNVRITKIEHVSQIPRPKKFPSSAFPKEVRERINEKSAVDLFYLYSLYGRTIEFHFVTEKNKQFHIEDFNKYSTAMLMWLYIVNQYASKSCSKRLTVFLYFTELSKKLPTTNMDILNQTHINTAFTTTCPTNSEIVVYRKEEWFKVFLHETFHNFALDFSDMNMWDCHSTILKIFKVKSEVNLYESYTEFWARVMNCCFCSFFSIQNQMDLERGKESISGWDANEFNSMKSQPQSISDVVSNVHVPLNGSKQTSSMFLFYFKNCIETEIIYGFFQMVKALDFMGLTYQDLYSNTQKSIYLREHMYKENTNVLSYYVIQMVLLNSFQSFLEWCDENNTSLLQFKKTYKNLRDFCEFIDKKYKTKSMLDGVYQAEEILKQIKEGFKSEMGTGTGTNKNKDAMYFLLSNLRMTVCELS